MKHRLLTFAITALMSLQSFANDPLPIVPMPREIIPSSGSFSLNRPLVISTDEYPGDSINRVMQPFVDMYEQASRIKVMRSDRNPNVKLQRDDSFGPEAYCLDITPSRITIKASHPAGFFYALQTLSQILRINPTDIPAMTINDSPEFGWRGFMLDEGRHFFGKDEVKRVIDIMALYKMNRFHWHLTEDQGWRVEIKKYPKLTSVGAWRGSNRLGWGDAWPTDSTTYGGYYTQDDIREIVSYAKDRFIEIVPEIDIPGHSQAAVASYPELLACDPENDHEVWLSQGISADVINVANPAAVTFAKDVIDELIPLFPFGYIHLGGDECPTNKWENNAACQKALAKIGSENYRDLQIDFIHKLKEHIDSKPADQRRKLIFWNEVLHGNTALLGDDITIMAWVGADRAALEASKRGMTTILSPQIPYYINRKQSKLPTEPMSQGSGTETVEAVYKYVPLANVPDNLKDKYMGVQANFWTEYVSTPEVLEYLMLPRLAAVAEAGWTPTGSREYDNFVNRIRRHAALYHQNGWNYAKHIME